MWDRVSCRNIHLLILSNGFPRFDGPRCLEIVKTNLCRHPPPLGLIFEGENVAVPTLRYTEFVEPPPQPTQTDLCAGWLFRFLDTAGEPVRPADAIRLGVEAGYSRATVYRARNILGGLVIDQGTGPYDPHKRWTLAIQPPSPPEDRPSPQERPKRDSEIVAAPARRPNRP